MKTRKIPMRMCIGCQEMKSKRELIRVVRNNENIVSVDSTGKKPGRGAYICKNKECFEKAKKTKKLERVFGCSVSEEVYAVLIKELEELDDK